MAGRKPTVTDQEILSEFALSADPVLTASEVAENLDISRQGVYKRLQDLEEDGLLRTKKVGSKARVWWITDEGQDFLESSRSSESA